MILALPSTVPTTYLYFVGTPQKGTKGIYVMIGYQAGQSTVTGRCIIEF